MHQVEQGVNLIICSQKCTFVASEFAQQSKSSTQLRFIYTYALEHKEERVQYDNTEAVVLFHYFHISFLYFFLQWRDERQTTADFIHAVSLLSSGLDNQNDCQTDSRREGAALREME